MRLFFPAVVVTGLFALPGFAAPGGFKPEEHFPKECLFYASIDVGRLRTAFKETPFGAILSHPAVRKALEGLETRLAGDLLRKTQAFTTLTGLDLFQFLDLFRGEVALILSGVDPAMGGPRMLLSVGVGPKRKEIEPVLERLGAALRQSGGGGDAESAEVKGHKVTTWPMRFGPSIQHAVIGDALVFSVGDPLEAVITRYQAGDGGTDGLRFGTSYSRAKLQTTVPSPLATVFVDWGAIRTLMLQFIPPPEGEKATRAFTALGLDKLASFTCRVGLREGDFESKLLLDSPGGLSGILGHVAECLSPAEHEAALSKVPATAIELSSGSIALGRLVRSTVETIRSGFPDEAGGIDRVLEEFERATGLSMAEDIYTLPKLSLYSFSTLPPGGGLVPDQVSIVRTSEFQPYLVALDKLAKKIGSEVLSLEIDGRSVAYMSGRILTRLEWFSGALWGSYREEGETLSWRMDWARSLSEPTLSLAFASVDPDWMVVASTPQAISRYFSSYTRLARALEDEDVSKILRKDIGKDALFSVLRGGRHFIDIYNTALSLVMVAAPILEKKFKELGIHPAYLPPGEDFRGGFRDGFLVTRVMKDGLLLHGHRVISNMAGSPTILSGILTVAFEKALETKAGSGPSSAEERLGKLGAALRKYAETAGMGAFPQDPAGSLAALQKVVDAGLIDDPSLLAHPGGGEKPASAGSDPAAPARIVLSGENVSYELVSWKQGPTDNPARVLAYEKKAYQGGGRYVLFVDLRVELIEEARFQEMLREQNAKYGKASGEENEK